MYSGAEQVIDTYKDSQDIGKAAKIPALNFSAKENDPGVVLNSHDIAQLARVMNDACAKLKNGLDGLVVQDDNVRRKDRDTYLKKINETQAIINAIAERALANAADIKVLSGDLRAMAKMMVYNTSNSPGLLIVTESIITRFNSPDYSQVSNTLTSANNYSKEIIGFFRSQYSPLTIVAQDPEEKTPLVQEAQPILTPAKPDLGQIIKDGFIGRCKALSKAIAWPFVKLGECIAKVPHNVSTPISLTERDAEQGRARPDKPGITNETTRLTETATPVPTTPVLYSVESIVKIKYSDQSKSMNAYADNEREQGRTSR